MVGRRIRPPEEQTIPIAIRVPIPFDKETKEMARADVRSQPNLIVVLAMEGLAARKARASEAMDAREAKP